MVGYPRLRYSNTNAFSLRTTLLGHLTIVFALLAALIGTLVTKGRVYPEEVHYLPKATEPGYKCNSTLIYPGQPFGGDATNSTFIWVTQNSFAYAGQSLGSCLVRPSSDWEGVVNPGTHELTYRYIVDCPLTPQQNATFKSASVSDVWTPYLRLINVTANAFLSNFPDSTGWSGLDGTDAELNEFSYSYTTNTFQIILTNSTLYRWDVTPTFLKTDAGQVIGAIGDAATHDFVAAGSSSINPLPGVLYPCTETRKVWAPTWTIVWECYTSLAATFSPVLTIVTWLLLRTSGSPDTQDARNSSRSKTVRLGLGTGRYEEIDNERDNMLLSPLDKRHA